MRQLLPTQPYLTLHEKQMMMTALAAVQQSCSVTTVQKFLMLYVSSMQCLPGAPS